MHIFSISVQLAVSGFVPSSAANRKYTGWLKDRVLKPARKLTLVVTFVPSRSARPDFFLIYFFLKINKIFKDYCGSLFLLFFKLNCKYEH